MRKIFKVLIIIIGTIVPTDCLAQIGPKLQLEGYTLIKNNTKHYIDTLFNNSISDISISFTNIGDEPLIISRVQGSDPCFAYSKSNLPIKSGEAGVIVIRCPTRPIGSRVTTSFTIQSNGIIESDSQFVITRWFND